MITYQNGNATVSITDDGSRIIQYADKMILDYPLNLDIRVSTKCSFGQRPDGSYVLCHFCHEGAKTDGRECNYEALKSKLVGLPKGIELAIGSNNFTDGLLDFLQWCKRESYIANVTINQGHLKRDSDKITYAINSDLIKGLGISYRSSLRWDVSDEILNYANTVFHVICGIDEYSDMLKLNAYGVKKLLILGEKDFGFNEGKVNLKSQNHKMWLWNVRALFDIYNVVSFDNLALEQLNIRRFFNTDDWNTFYQGEHSFYIDAAMEQFKPSSRSSESVNWNDMDLVTYFKTYIHE